MMVPVDQGNFLAWLVSTLGVQRAIELGTFTGYSALVLAKVHSHNQYRSVLFRVGAMKWVHACTGVYICDAACMQMESLALQSSCVVCFISVHMRRHAQQQA